METRKQNVLSEIKTLVRILNTWGNALVPELDGKQVTAQERLSHFVRVAQDEFGMTLDEIDAAIA
ncbi:hypothetical protein [Allopusillimonas ginsengisoli]|uniref:hypothetical protein n=1 Tax=Allopusillimonas ginsengisoli TaxID=453575 RepID=UPI001021D53F|nr:hypothetical protein [Allopusillimonas ginsengisoli]TEA78672.1 hypothetical protein ERE07_09770 [Allopusillimonas ginsengisoli]